MTEKTRTRLASHGRILDLTYVAMFAVVIAICSWISIPTTVPFTLQTFAVFLTVLLLGGRLGTLAVLVYLLLGAVGVPVFAGFSAGPAVLFGPTGGYLLGFLVTGLSYWLVMALLGKWIEDKPGRRRAAQLAGILLGTVLLYVFGTVWFVHVYTAGGNAVTYGTALMWCVVPFLVPEVFKLALAFLLADRLRPHMYR